MPGTTHARRIANEKPDRYGPAHSPAFLMPLNPIQRALQIGLPLAASMMCANAITARAAADDYDGHTREQMEEAVRTLRKALFKKPALSIPAPRATPLTRRAEPVKRAQPVPPRAVALAPAPAPRVPTLPSELATLSVQPTSFTPYDRFFANVRQVTAKTSSSTATMQLACRLMERGHRFRYLVTDRYRPNPPSVTAHTQVGDCKSKALWLYENLGDRTALYVIGKAEKNAKDAHAWVYWYSQGRWWILDPTSRPSPIAAESVSKSRYIPYYSFGKGGSYRHKASALLTTASTESNRRPNPVAAQTARR
jgi:hypothetical protein